MLKAVHRPPEHECRVRPRRARRCHVEALVHGNLTAAEAAELGEGVRSTLGAGCCAAAAERTRDQCGSLPEGKQFVYRWVRPEASPPCVLRGRLP